MTKRSERIEQAAEDLVTEARRHGLRVDEIRARVIDARVANVRRQ